MKQLFQNLGSGETTIEDVPVPVALPGTVVIRSTNSLISAGTERMLVEFSRSSLAQKARREPQRVKQVLNKAKSDGVLTTVKAVRSKLANAISLGYCSAGVVVETGEGVTKFAVGDRVASNGPHAEYVRVPVNLCAKIPDGVDVEAAAFTPLASIALQSVRLAEPTLGETVVVIGLGLVGLMAVQILTANGCVVIGVDPNPQRRQLAKELGADIVVSGQGKQAIDTARAETGGAGADAVIIAASTKSEKPLAQAAGMARVRGRIVLVGVVGTAFDRDPFYRKELTFSVSHSYGPGRDDPLYEQQGQDYPIGLVRWTEQRNFEAVLGLMARGRLRTKPLVTHVYPIGEAENAYDIVTKDPASLAVVLTYPDAQGGDADGRTIVLQTASPLASGKASVGFLGLGNYGARMLAPAFRRAGASLKTVVTTGGPGSVVPARANGFANLSSDPEALFGDETINAVAIATRHSEHAGQAIKALEAGKSVFVEKPLAIDGQQLLSLEKWVKKSGNNTAAPILTVGYNRRFSPHTANMKSWLDNRAEPASLILLMNAGILPSDHWTQDPKVGGGRLIGEACHMIDLARYLIGMPINGVQVTALGGKRASGVAGDSANISLFFEDGSTATVHYLCNGSTSYAKERVEAFCGGGVALIDNFVRSKAYGIAGYRGLRGWSQDKGHDACVAAFVDAVEQGKPSPIPIQELLEVARVSIEADAQARQMAQRP